MYSTNPNSYEKFTSSPPPPPYGGAEPPTAGIPLSLAGDSFYTSDNSKPSYLPPEAKPKVPWSSGLCDCFSDVPNCCLTCWCPCITFGRVAEIVDKGSSACGVNGALYTLIVCVTGCACWYSCFYRAKMRQQHSLHESPYGDCLVHCFCEYCALCQEHRELKNRGYDMSIGWHGNVERQNRGLAMEPMPPIVEEKMSRDS